MTSDRDEFRPGTRDERSLPPGFRPAPVAALARYPDQLRISQDAGWYHVGEAHGGTVAPLDWLPRGCVPILKDAGVTEEAIDLLLVRNPRRAFVIQ